MTLARMSPASPFGALLRHWRRDRGRSQLDLAIEAETSPRHVSFIETGRSRPGRELVLRLAEALELPLRDRNELLVAAGLAREFPEHPLDDDQLRPYRNAIRALLDRHDPYPASAVDVLGRVLMTNAATRPDGAASLNLRFRVGGQIIEAFTTVVRFEAPREITLSELRVELMFPVDEPAARFFRDLVEAAARQT
jgi:transcriptional regulator with XRE-family HTH domain